MEESAPIPSPSLWSGIVSGGPYVVTAFYAMLLSFGLALYLSFRRRCSTAALLCSIAPFVFGASILWLGVLGLSLRINSPMYEGDSAFTLRQIQLPFFLGAGLPAAALALNFLARALHSKARNA